MAITDAPVRIDGADGRHYPYPPTGELLDSVTTVIGGTNAKPWLTVWSGGVSMAWAVDNMQLMARTLRDEGRDAAIALGKDAAEKIRALKADAGTYVHDVLEALIYWARRGGSEIALPVLPEHLQNALYDGEPLTEVVGAMVDGFINWVSDFSPHFLAAEMPVYHYELRVAGTLDLIVVLTGYNLCADPACTEPGCGGRGAHLVPAPGNELAICVDNKTGREPEGTWREQLSIYRRCPECRPDKLDSELFPTPPTRAGAVLHLRREYPDGYLFMLVASDKDEAAWDTFQAAVKTYRDRQAVKSKPGKSVRPLRPDGTIPGPRLCDLAAEGYGRALAPLRKALGAATELEDLARFTEAEVLAVKGVGPKLIDTIRVMLTDHGMCLAGEDTPATAKAA